MNDPCVTIVPLVPNLPLPTAATARTRTEIPPGYGVQEHCLPFTAASGMGVLIGSPIRFGLCTPDEAPNGCRTFRSPFDTVINSGVFEEPRMFYVFDNADCQFRGNAYRFEGIPVDKSPPILEPGISFFDRPDQQHLFKLHLPYLWRTAEGIDTLFQPLINRVSQGLAVLSGLVETDWYPSPVNLIIAKPEGSFHISPGDPIAHAIFIPRPLRRPALTIAAPHSRINREARKGLAEWDQRHTKDRGAYKALARERQE